MKLSMAFVSMCEAGVSGETIVSSIVSTCPTKGNFVGGVY
jgi:hypothetical protein